MEWQLPLSSHDSPVAVETGSASSMRPSPRSASIGTGGAPISVLTPAPASGSGPCSGTSERSRSSRSLETAARAARRPPRLALATATAMPVRIFGVLQHGGRHSTRRGHRRNIATLGLDPRRGRSAEGRAALASLIAGRSPASESSAPTRASPTRSGAGASLPAREARDPRSDLVGRRAQPIGCCSTTSGRVRSR